MELGVPIPSNAIGRVGMLVELQQIRDLSVGRLAIVRHPVGWVKELLNTDQPVFAWQVFLTGEPALVNGHETQEIIVADKCLRPVSQLEEQDMTAMVEQRQQDVVKSCIAEVHALVSQDDIESPEFERALHLAFGQAELNFAKEVVGVAQVLSEAGFWKQNGSDGEALEWRSVFEGTEISMAGAPGMFGDWQLSAYAIKARSWHMPERQVLNDWPRGKILQILLELWENVFGNRRIPRQLELGWMYRTHLCDMRAIELVLPHVVMEGVSFRRALRWLREAYEKDDMLVGPPEDMPVAVEIKDGVLRLSTEDYSIGINLKRGWVDAMRLSLRNLLALPPSAVRRPRIRMEWTGEFALINGYKLSAWTD